MTPRSLTLAALASAAVPGVAPTSVTPCSSPHRRGVDRYHTAVVTDSRQARWVVRLPADKVGAARQDGSLALLRVVGPRLPFEIPAPAGRVAVRDGRGALVYPYLAGFPLDVARVPARSRLAARIGRAVAAIHNLDRRLVDEAGLPTYDADECRRRHVTELDRAAATRHVPTRLLARWERALDDVSRWRFAPTVVHGRLDGARFLVVAEDVEDSETGEIVGVTGWDGAGVADPAVDFADLVRRCSPAAADTVFEAYAMAREEPVDPMMLQRAALLAELDTVGAFVSVTVAQDHQGITRIGAELAELDARVGDRDARSRADAEPLIETVPRDGSPEPVGDGVDPAGEVEPGADQGDDATRKPPHRTPEVDLEARQLGGPEHPAAQSDQPRR